MKYPVAIQPGDQSHAIGVVVPNLPGCFSAGDTLESAHQNAKEAIASWIEVELNEGHQIPMPSNIEDWAKQEEFKGWTFDIVDVSFNNKSI